MRHRKGVGSHGRGVREELEVEGEAAIRIYYVRKVYFQ